MDLVEDGCERGWVVLCREIVDHWVLDRVPVHAEDSLVVREDATRDCLDVAHNAGAIITCLCIVDRDFFLTLLAECSNLRHVRVVQNVERLGHDMHVGSLSQWRRVRITDKRGLQVEGASFVECPGEARDVLASIALPSHKEWLVLEWELRPDVGDQVHELGGGLLHSGQERAAIRKPGTDGLIDVDHGRLLRPRLLASVHTVRAI